MNTKYSLLFSISIKHILKFAISLIAIFTLTACSNSKQEPQIPATAEALAGILDLETFVLMPGAVPPRQRGLASLSYTAAANMNSAYNFHQKFLLDNKWSELPGSYVSDQMTSAAFEKNGFYLSLTLTPGSQTNHVDINMQHHGNLNLAKIKLSDSLTQVAALPMSAIYSSTLEVEQLADNCKKSLVAAGWVPYGSTGASRYFKQNNILLNVMISPSPAQTEKSMLNLSSIAHSTDLPVPAEIDNPDYQESSQTLSYVTSLPKERIYEFYMSKLSKRGWSQSIDKGTITDGKEILTYRNAKNDMIVLSIEKRSETEIKVELMHQTVAAIAEMNRRLDEQAAEFKKKNNIP